MRIEVDFFIGLFLSIWLVGIILLDFLFLRSIINKKRDFNLKKNICEFCGSVYFIYLKGKYWRCPFCSSINIKKDDNRDRDSGW